MTRSTAPNTSEISSTAALPSGRCVLGSGVDAEASLGGGCGGVSRRMRRCI